MKSATRSKARSRAARPRNRGDGEEVLLEMTKGTFDTGGKMMAGLRKINRNPRRGRFVGPWLSQAERRRVAR